IHYFLFYPYRLLLELPRLDLAKLQKLEFYDPDRERFPAIDLAYRALRLGGAAPAALNAANEVAVAAFLNERIGFGDITRVIGRVLDHFEKESAMEAASIEDVLKVDRSARLNAEDFIKILTKAQGAH